MSKAAMRVEAHDLLTGRPRVRGTKHAPTAGGYPLATLLNVRMADGGGAFAPLLAAKIPTLQTLAGNRAVAGLVRQAGPSHPLLPEPVGGGVTIQRIPPSGPSWVEQMAKDINTRHKNRRGPGPGAGGAKPFLGKSLWILVAQPTSRTTRSVLAARGISHTQLVTALKSKVKPLLRPSERSRIDPMSTARFGRFLQARFTIWGCDALLRASLKEYYRREGKAAAGEKPPIRRETFQTAQVLRSSGWKSYLLDLDIPSPAHADRRKRQFAKATKVEIDKVLSRADVAAGALTQITGKEYYFGLTYGAVHNFIGSRSMTYHGQWNAFPGQRRPRAVTMKPLHTYLSGERRLLILAP